MECTNDQWIFDLAAKHESRRDGLCAPVIFDSYGLLEFASELLAARPVRLGNIEQYRQQMAGISCAAFGHWKEGDSIHSDYDTVTLRDVAKLYAKYEARCNSHEQLVAALRALDALGGLGITAHNMIRAALAAAEA